MKVKEVTNEAVDPGVMKLRFEIAKLRADMEEKDEFIAKLGRDVAKLQLTVAKLIQKLGPQK